MEALVQITRCRHLWPEKKGFIIDRPHGLREHTFLHFLNEVDLLVNGQMIQAPAGSLIFYHSETPQWFQSNVPLMHNWMHLTGNLRSSLEQVGLQANVLYLPQNSQFITDLLREIEGEILSRRPFHEALLELKYMELLAKIARACSGSSSPTPPSTIKESQFQELRQQMFTNPEHNWTVSELASIVHLSPSRFYDVYRAIFQISPTADLIQARIDRSKRYLIDTSVPIHEIAEATGYSNVTHFCRQFKQLTGITPTQYREQG